MFRGYDQTHQDDAVDFKYFHANILLKLNEDDDDNMAGKVFWPESAGPIPQDGQVLS